MKLKTTLSVLAVTAVSVFAQPKLFVDNNVFDWGSTPEGSEKIKHSFIIVNKGNEELKISNIRTSCGCTIAKYDTLLAPGKTGTITAEFDKSGRTGYQEKVLTVSSNDADSAQIRLTLKGTITTVLDVSPRWFQLYSEKGKVTGKISFTTANNDLKISNAKYSVNGKDEKVNIALILANKSKPDQNGNITYNFDFSFTRNVDKYEGGNLMFDTNMPEKPNFSLGASIEPKKDAPY